MTTSHQIKALTPTISVVMSNKLLSMTVWAILSVTLAACAVPVEPPSTVDCQKVNDNMSVETLLRFPERHAGRCFQWTGRVEQRLSETQFVIETRPDLYAWEAQSKLIVVGEEDCISPGTSGRILEGDHVGFIAKFVELREVETVLGALREIPLVFCAPTVELIPNDSSTDAFHDVVEHSSFAVNPIWGMPGNTIIGATLDGYVQFDDGETVEVREETYFDGPLKMGSAEATEALDNAFDQDAIIRELRSQRNSRK